MFTRTVNSDVLTSEGLNPPISQPPVRRLPWGARSDEASDSTAAAAATATAAPQHKMRLWWYFVHPSHANAPRPVVDASMPFTSIDETHQARKYAAATFVHMMISPADITSIREDVPYANTHHSGELVRLCVILANLAQANYFFSRAYVAGLAITRMRYKQAYVIAAVMGHLRATIATLIGAGGYFYSFEYLYTHGPPPFRIRDPSPNGYRMGWREGQSCYLARMLASSWVPIGIAFYKGTSRACSTWLALSLVLSVYWEYARINIMPAMRLSAANRASQEHQVQAGLGSLSPWLRQRLDPDTGRNESVAQNRYLTFMSKTMQNTMWERSISHEDTMFAQRVVRLPNPYYNWAKARQMYDEKPRRYKNDLWHLPRILSVCAPAFS